MFYQLSLIRLVSGALINQSTNYVLVKIDQANNCMYLLVRQILYIRIDYRVFFNQKG